MCMKWRNEQIPNGIFTVFDVHFEFAIKTIETMTNFERNKNENPNILLTESNKC